MCAVIVMTHSGRRKLLLSKRLFRFEGYMSIIESVSLCQFVREIGKNMWFKHLTLK